MKKIHQESCMGEGRRSEGRRRERRRTGRNGSRKGRHRERQKEKKARELRRKGNSDATVRDLLPASRSLSRGWVSFPSAPLTLQSPSSALSPVRAPAAGPLPRPAPAFVSACHLPVNPTKRTWEKHKARAQMCPQTLSHPSPHAGRYSPSQMPMCLERSGVRVLAGEAEKLFFPLSAPQRSQNPRTSGGGEGENHTKPQQPPTEWTPVPLARHSLRAAPREGGAGQAEGGGRDAHSEPDPRRRKGSKSSGPCAPRGWARVPPGLVRLPPGEGKVVPPDS